MIELTTLVTIKGSVAGPGRVWGRSHDMAKMVPVYDVRLGPSDIRKFSENDLEIVGGTLARKAFDGSTIAARNGGLDGRDSLSGKEQSAG